MQSTVFFSLSDNLEIIQNEKNCGIIELKKKKRERIQAKAKISILQAKEKIILRNSFLSEK